MELKYLHKVPAWLLFVWHLGDRDEHAGPHHQHCLPGTRHDRPGRKGPRAGMGELWPCSVAWPTPGIVWMLQSDIYGEPKWKLERSLTSTTDQSKIQDIHDKKNKSQFLQRFSDFTFCPVWTTLVLINEVLQTYLLVRLKAQLDLNSTDVRDDADENFSMFWNWSRPQSYWIVFLKQAQLCLVVVTYLASVWS